MPDVVVIRPGCTDFDEQHRIQGTLNLPLNPRGEAQVEGLVDQLCTLPLEVIYTAPCEPARTTAEAIGAGLGIAVKELEGLRNLDQGLWQGLHVDDVRRMYPKVFKQLRDSPETICPPQGETVPHALERIHQALRKPFRRKQAFGIVVPEPLATLVCWVVRGSRVETPVPICGCGAQPIEWLHSNGNECSTVRLNGTAPPQKIETLNGAAPSSHGGDST